MIDSLSSDNPDTHEDLANSMKEIQEQLEQLKQSINPTRELVASTFLDYLKVLNQKFLAGASFGMSSPAYKLSGSVD